MKRTIRNWLAALLFVTTAGGALVVTATPQTSYAVSCEGRLLTFPAWYNGLAKADGNTCQMKSPTEAGGISNYIWTIALNIVDMILQLVGYISVGFIIFGGYKYMISAGSPDGMVKARKTITNAVVGLVLSIFSVAIVNLVAGTLR
jgi:hypothetical protein